MPELPPQSDSDVLVLLTPGVWERVTTLAERAGMWLDRDDDDKLVDLEAGERGAVLAYLLGWLDAKTTTDV